MTGISVIRAEDPLTCVVHGADVALDDFKRQAITYQFFWGRSKKIAQQVTCLCNMNPSVNPMWCSWR